jgi:hypothetical protein
MLRDFVLAIYRLFDPEQSPHQARCRRAALVKDPRYQADPDLVRALGMLGPEKFDKMVTFLHRPAASRVRTNNHVERTNRRLRHFEKVRYKWRRRRAIVRFLVLARDRWHRQRMTQGQRADARPRKPHAPDPVNGPPEVVASNEKTRFFVSFQQVRKGSQMAPWSRWATPGWDLGVEMNGVSR